MHQGPLRAVFRVSENRFLGYIAATPAERETDIREWLNILETEARTLSEAPPEDVVDPLQAIASDMLGGF